jgi:plastocyanin domain-containing protein
MINKRKILASLVGFGLLLGVASGAISQPSDAPSPPIQHQATAQMGQFLPREQPVALKVGVAMGGLALIGLELWWFLWSQPKSQRVASTGGVQELKITVDGGYEPSRVVVKAGQPVRLNFLRRDPNSCLEQVLLPDFQIAQALELNRVTPVEFTPEKPGQYPFTCGMNMFRGVVEVQSSS